MPHTHTHARTSAAGLIALEVLCLSPSKLTSSKQGTKRQSQSMKFINENWNAFYSFLITRIVAHNWAGCIRLEITLHLRMCGSVCACVCVCAYALLYCMCVCVCVFKGVYYQHTGQCWWRAVTSWRPCSAGSMQKPAAEWCPSTESPQTPSCLSWSTSTLTPAVPVSLLHTTQTCTEAYHGGPLQYASRLTTVCRFNGT